MYINVVLCPTLANRDLPVKPAPVVRGPKSFTLRQTVWASRARFAGEFAFHPESAWFQAVRDRPPARRCSTVSNGIAKNVKWGWRGCARWQSRHPSGFVHRSPVSAPPFVARYPGRLAMFTYLCCRCTKCAARIVLGRVGAVHVSAASPGAAAPAASALSILRIIICAGALLRDGKRRAARRIRPGPSKCRTPRPCSGKTA